MRIKLLSLLFLSILTIGNINAENQEGTGLLSVRLAVDSDQRAVAYATLGRGLAVFGSTQLTDGYGEIALDAVVLHTGKILPRWGRAELVVDCNFADVVLFANRGGGEIELLSTRIPVDGCTTTQ